MTGGKAETVVVCLNFVLLTQSDQFTSELYQIQFFKKQPSTVFFLLCNLCEQTFSYVNYYLFFFRQACNFRFTRKILEYFSETRRKKIFLLNLLIFFIFLLSLSHLNILPFFQHSPSPPPTPPAFPFIISVSFNDFFFPFCLLACFAGNPIRYEYVKQLKKGTRVEKSKKKIEKRKTVEKKCIKYSKRSTPQKKHSLNIGGFIYFLCVCVCFL